MAAATRKELCWNVYFIRCYFDQCLVAGLLYFVDNLDSHYSTFLLLWLEKVLPENSHNVIVLVAIIMPSYYQRKVENLMVFLSSVYL